MATNEEPTIWNPREDNVNFPGCPSIPGSNKWGIYVEHVENSSTGAVFTKLPGPNEQEVPDCSFGPIQGYCTPEDAEADNFGKSVEVYHNGQSYIRIHACGCLQGGIDYGIYLNDGYGNWIPKQIGTDFLTYFPTTAYDLQVFACDNEVSCGTLGIGGNWAANPVRPGRFYAEVNDPFGLRCPGQTGNWTGTDIRRTNFALPEYLLTGHVVKYDLYGEMEYELDQGDYLVRWTTTPPERPVGAEWPPRHLASKNGIESSSSLNANGAWVGRVPISYHKGGDVFPEEWNLELVWNQRDGLWMIILYGDLEKNVTPEERRSRWYDVFVNPHPIGPCGLTYSDLETERKFIPVRTVDSSVLEGSFIVDLSSSSSSSSQSSSSTSSSSSSLSSSSTSSSSTSSLVPCTGGLYATVTFGGGGTKTVFGEEFYNGQTRCLQPDYSSMYGDVYPYFTVSPDKRYWELQESFWQYWAKTGLSLEYYYDEHKALYYDSSTELWVLDSGTWDNYYDSFSVDGGTYYNGDPEVSGPWPPLVIDTGSVVASLSSFQ